MILLGNKKISTEQTTFIKTQNDIQNTAPNSTVLFTFDIELMKYCQINDINFGVLVNNIKESIYANNLSARYIITHKDITKQIQDIATSYMFDSRVLAIIEKDKEIEEIALKSIDGIVYKSILK